MADKGIIVLMYHAVVRDRAELAGLLPEDRPYAVSQQALHDQLTALKDKGFTAVSTGQLLELLQGVIPDCRDRVLLTFDDGYRAIFTNAVPVLKEHKMKAVVFVTAGNINTPGFMTWGQVRELADNGFEIGSHSQTHAFLPDLKKEDILLELTQSRNVIEKNIGKPVLYFSLPGGREPRGLGPVAQVAGYEAVFTSRPGLCRPGDSRYAIRRIPIRYTTTREEFNRIIQGDQKILRRLAWSYLVKNGIQRILGHRLYHLYYTWRSSRVGT